MPRYGYRDFFEPTRPRVVEGGIKLQSKSGKDQSWWARRWLAVLESFDIGTRVQRGRAYARQGQVTNLTVDSGSVAAKVQGSRPKPYDVHVGVKKLTDSQWSTVAGALSQQAIFAARLLAGEMPHDVEDVFAQANVSLFPETETDLDTDCSCPDMSNPCKHIAAVYYLLGDEFDRDPFLIFKLRGITREELMAKMSAYAEPTPTPESVDPPETGGGGESAAPEPLSTMLDVFWSGTPAPETARKAFDARVPAIHAALPKQLGAFPFWRGSRPFLDVMSETYLRASKTAVAIVEGED